MNDSGALQLTTPTDREVVLTRVFDAARGLVFDAFTKPDLLKRWMEAPGRSMAVCEIDLKVGGAYRFVWRGQGKFDVGMFGIFRDVAPPERFVRTESWEDWEADETLVTAGFAEQGGKTTVTTTVLFPSKEIRDEILKSGIEKGATENFNRLAAMLASITSQRER